MATLDNTINRCTSAALRSRLQPRMLAAILGVLVSAAWGCGDDGTGGRDDGGTPHDSEVADSEVADSAPPTPSSALIDDQTLVIPQTAEVADTVGHAKIHPTVTLAAPAYQILSGNASGIFAIQSTTGKITIATGGLPDAATTPSHALEVQVSDGATASDTAVITVEVLADDNVVYVDPDNTADPSPDGSRAHPFVSFDDFSITEGFAYLLRRGTTLTRDAALELGRSHLLIGAYGSGARPVLHCTASNAGGNVHALFNWNGPQGVTVRDLEIYAPDATSCVRFGGDTGADATVDNCVLHDSHWGLRAFGLTGLKVLYTEVYNIADDGMFIQNVTDIEVGYNDVHDVNTLWQFPYTPQTEAGGDAVQLSDCNQWHVHHNRLDRTNSGNKFCFISNNEAQDDGVFEHNHLRGPLTDGDGGASIYFGSGADLIVRYNLIEGPSPGALYHHSDNLQFYGNVVWNLSAGVQCHVSSACVVENNVFHEAGQHIYASGDLVARNNIFSLINPADEALVCDGALTESHNLYSEGPGGTSSVLGDPLFVDAAGGNFRLQAGSPAIDTGIDASRPFDMDGNPIPTGSAPDIGAFEYQP